MILGSPAVLGAEDGPFSLPLSDGTSVVCERVVRRVPGARLVCSGRWQGRAIYAKIFIGPRAERHGRAGRRGEMGRRLGFKPALHVPWQEVAER